MKGVWIYCFLFLFIISQVGLVTTQDSTINSSALKGIGEGINTKTDQIGQGAERVGQWILKAQEVFKEFISFITLGFFDSGEKTNWIYFLFIILLILLIYDLLSFTNFTSPFLKIPLSIILTLLGVMWLDKETIETLMIGPEGIYLIIALLLPPIIILTFVSRISYRAYSGKGSVSPFAAKIINFLILVPFGIFFIKNGELTTEIIKTGRYLTGWFFLILSIAQFFLLKPLIKSFWSTKDGAEKEIKESLEKIHEEKLKEDAIDVVDDKKPE